MQRTDLSQTFCPLARTLDCIGEWWSLLILRDAFQGVTRFEDFKQSLGISTNILTRRLQHLTARGILTRRLYQQKPARHDYVLTSMGHNLFPVLLTIYDWGNRYQTEDGIIVQLADRDTDAPFEPVVVDRNSGDEIRHERVILKTGPLAPPGIVARAELMRRLHPRQSAVVDASTQTGSALSVPALSVPTISVPTLSVSAKSMQTRSGQRQPKLAKTASTESTTSHQKKRPRS